MKVARHPQESPEYAKLRDELTAAEVALRDQRERVAELRRRLPLEAEVPDYALRGVDAPLGRSGAPREFHLSDLFEDPSKPLIAMHFMFGGAQSDPCPMCTSWADAYDGSVPHLTRVANFAVLVAGDVERIRAYGHERGWRNLRLFSTADSELKRDLGFEAPDGTQMPGVSVFTRRDDTLLHFYSASAYYGEAGFRGMDLLNPLWHFLDLLPEGRGDFMPK